MYEFTYQERFQYRKRYVRVATLIRKDDIRQFCAFQYRKRYVRVATLFVVVMLVVNVGLPRFNTASGMYALQH